MDIARPSNARARTMRRIAYGTSAIVLLGGVTLGLSRLRPAPPAIERAAVWIDAVQWGDMRREVRGLGVLVPEEARWIPARTEARVDRIVVRPGAVVGPDTVILELSNPELERDVLDAEYQLRAAEADYASLKVQVASEQLNQKAAAAEVESAYQEAKLQAQVDEQLSQQGLAAEVRAQLSRVKAEQLALYELRRSQLDALRVRAGIQGVLQVVPVEAGEQVVPGTNLARVADPAKLKAEIMVPETQAKDLRIGQHAAIDTRNGIVAGRVSRIDPAVQNGTVTVDVALEEALPVGARPDLTVEGLIEIETLRDILYVGRPVFGQAESTVGLFKLIQDGSEAARVRVTLGRGSVSTIEVVEGLRAGDRVILSDTSAWDDFDRVRLR
jgi:HlyD family secretion protein